MGHFPSHHLGGEEEAGERGDKKGLEGKGEKGEGGGTFFGGGKEESNSSKLTPSFTSIPFASFLFLFLFLFLFCPFNLGFYRIYFGFC